MSFRMWFFFSGAEEISVVRFCTHSFYQTLSFKSDFSLNKDKNEHKIWNQKPKFL